MKAQSIMTTNVAFCKGNTRLDEVARLMASYHCSALPVVDDDRSRHVVGIVTDRDIVRRTLGRGRNPAGLTASDCMTPDVYVASKDSEIEECLETMESHHVRRLPVIDEESAVCGIITLADLARTLPATKYGEVAKVVTDPTAHNGGRQTQVFPPAASRPEPFQIGGVKPPYHSPKDLPNKITEGMPVPAQELFYDAFTRAFKELLTTHSANSGNDIEKSAATVAWAAVKQQYRKAGRKWIPKNPTPRT